MSTTLRSIAVGALILACPAYVRAQIKEMARLEKCRDVIQEMATVPEGIPNRLLDKARCVVVIPGVKKAAFGVGARLGWGTAVCRTEGGEGPWGAPLMVSLKGGSFGFQIGGQSSDFVLLVMDPKGIDHLLSSKFTLGADASIAAGPIGRNAEAGTDLSMRAEILSYSRSRGIFAGVSLEGASLAPDHTANDRLYKGPMSRHDLLFKPSQRMPAAARALVDTLQRYSPDRVARADR